jgi:YHS domain-containing protein
MKKIILLVLIFTAIVNLAQNSDQGPFYEKKGAVLEGYDMVSYHIVGKPVKGKKEFSYNWNNALWYFSSQENLNTFKASPEKYAPEYGGYCAWAAAQNYFAKSDPKAWKIVNGRLFFNYNKSIQRRWEKNTADNIQKADANWPVLRKEKLE